MFTPCRKVQKRIINKEKVNISFFPMPPQPDVVQHFSYKWPFILSKFVSNVVDKNIENVERLFAYFLSTNMSYINNTPYHPWAAESSNLCRQRLDFDVLEIYKIATLLKAELNRGLI